MSALGELTKVATLGQSIVLARARENGLEGRDDGSVELTVDSLRETETRDAARHRVAVRAILGHRVVRIGDSDDA